MIEQPSTIILWKAWFPYQHVIANFPLLTAYTHRLRLQEALAERETGNKKCLDTCQGKIKFVLTFTSQSLNFGMVENNGVTIVDEPNYFNSSLRKHNKVLFW